MIPTRFENLNMNHGFHRRVHDMERNISSDIGKEKPVSLVVSVVRLYKLREGKTCPFTHYLLKKN